MSYDLNNKIGVSFLLYDILQVGIMGILIIGIQKFFFFISGLNLAFHSAFSIQGGARCNQAAWMLGSSIHSHLLKYLYYSFFFFYLSSFANASSTQSTLKMKFKEDTEL